MHNLQHADVLFPRISDAENQVGGGLIEEVIQVAEGELKLVEAMAESKVYVQCPVANQPTENSIFESRRILTLRTDGTSLKRSRRRANGTTSLEINTLQARRSLRINRTIREPSIPQPSITRRSARSSCGSHMRLCIRVVSRNSRMCLLLPFAEILHNQYNLKIQVDARKLEPSKRQHPTLPYPINRHTAHPSFLSWIQLF